MTHSIMLVDDDRDLRFLLGVALKRAGYTVHEARDGEHALVKLETIVPDLFIIDVMMPGIDGFELCEQLRAKEETAQHPILLLSARTDTASMMRGLESGANLYLHKPIETDNLLERIGQFLTVDVQE
jgi:DNA-binding response OmpR family regulator